MNTTIIEAIKNQVVIQFDYEGEPRIVEPHCYGETLAGNEGLRAFQIGGYSSSGKMGWKMYDLSKASSIEVTDDTFNGPRPDYNPGDKGMSRIFTEI